MIHALVVGDRGVVLTAAMGRGIIPARFIREQRITSTKPPETLIAVPVMYAPQLSAWLGETGPDECHPEHGFPVGALLHFATVQPVYGNDAARRFLERLGRTGAEVAEELRRRGIRGERSNVCDCPLSVVLRVEGYAPSSTSFWAVGISRLDHMGGPGNNLGPLLPRGPAEFRDEFDHGKHPDLDIEPHNEEIGE